LIDSETAIEKGFSDLVDCIFIIAKILFEGKANQRQNFKISPKKNKPRFGEPRGARERAERQRFSVQNSMGGSASRPRKFRQISRKSDSCAPGRS